MTILTRSLVQAFKKSSEAEDRERALSVETA